MRNVSEAALGYRPSHESAGHEYLHNASAPRVNTEVVMIQALRRQYPQLHVICVPALTTSLLGYVSTGRAEATPLPGDAPLLEAPLTHRTWLPAGRRTDPPSGILMDQVLFGKFSYKWNHHEFILYVAEGRDGSGSYPIATFNYILGTDAHAIDALIAECSAWSVQLHNEIWVFDNGFWQKNRDLWQGIQNSEWEDVILDPDMKAAIRHDITDFYSSRGQYEKYHVPWKRGLIFHGPPGNGKTISIKATMHELLQRKDPIPTLYVRSLNSFAGPEFAVSQIFNMARRQAPCFLVFEDLDSIVTDQVRSYFLNEVDGLGTNNGILMVGSTNHLDRLDPGLAKRPARFDRKYLFPDPDLDQRTQYAQYWQKKLADSEEIEFPDKLCPAVAGITDGFSFAYIQEAFVASLLALARRESSGPGFEQEDKGDGLPAFPSDATQASWNRPGGGFYDNPDLVYRDVPKPGSTVADAEMHKVMESLREKKNVYEQLLAQLEQKAKLNAAAAAPSEEELALDDDDDGPALGDLPLWREFKKQVAILREGMKDEQITQERLDLFGRSYGRTTLGCDAQDSSHKDLLGREIRTRMPEGMLEQVGDWARETGGKVWLDH